MENSIQPVSKQLIDFNRGLIATTVLLTVAILFLIFSFNYKVNGFFNTTYFGLICFFSSFNYFLIIKFNKRFKISSGGLILRHLVNLIFLLWLLVSLMSLGRISAMEFTPIVLITMLYEVHQWLRQLILFKKTKISINLKKRSILYIIITVVILILFIITSPYITLFLISYYLFLGYALLFLLLNIDYALNL